MTSALPGKPICFINTGCRINLSKERNMTEYKTKSKSKGKKGGKKK